jgi:acyl-CoA thioesterase-1
MNPILIHLGSGAGFFSGMGIVALAVCLMYVLPNRWMLAGCDILMVVGMLLVGLSSTPVPAGLLPVWCVATAAAVIVLHFRSISPRTRAVFAAPPVALCLLAAGIELPHHFTPSAPAGSFTRLYVLGDSITAGIGQEDGPRWPSIVQHDTGVNVVDLAISGARVNDMSRVAARSKLSDGLVLIEIGGNDVFRRASVEEFERDLDDLLSRVDGSGRSIVMLELPLVPFHAEIGRIQRRVAKKHGVTLIPKRYFASVFAGADATIDGLHLSTHGHQHMARVVEELLGKSLRP